jgi:hypothetical protein
VLPPRHAAEESKSGAALSAGGGRARAIAHWLYGTSSTGARPQSATRTTPFTAGKRRLTHHCPVGLFRPSRNLLHNHRSAPLLRRQGSKTQRDHWERGSGVVSVECVAALELQDKEMLQTPDPYRPSSWAGLTGIGAPVIPGASTIRMEARGAFGLRPACGSGHLRVLLTFCPWTSCTAMPSQPRWGGPHRSHLF